MQVTIALHGVFRRGRFKETVEEVPEGTTLEDLAAHLQLPPVLLDIILLNGVHAGRSVVVKDGDRVAFLLLLEGG